MATSMCGQTYALMEMLVTKTVAARIGQANALGLTLSQRLRSIAAAT